MDNSTRMSIKRMMVLVSVARSGSLSGAARALHYTPSAVSQQIALLESEAGHALVRRTARGVQLTDAGRIVVRHAERMERMQEAAQRELGELDSLNAGLLRLGTFPSLTQSLLPEVLTEFRTRAPNVGVSLVSGTRDDQRMRLESGEVEIAFLWDYSFSPVIATADEEVVFLADDPCVLLVPSDHWLAGAGVSTVEGLSDEDWITRSTVADRDLLRRALGSEGREVRPVFEGHSYEEMQAMVEAGVGIAVVPQSATALLRPGIAVVEVSDAPVRRFLFARRRHARMSAAAAVMNSLLRSRTAAQSSSTGGVRRP
jgi:DNA-binding transcriptional LysR family regulator